jgi:hypothetical protein
MLTQQHTTDLKIEYGAPVRCMGGRVMVKHEQVFVLV